MARKPEIINLVRQIHSEKTCWKRLFQSDRALF